MRKKYDVSDPPPFPVLTSCLDPPSLSCTHAMLPPLPSLHSRHGPALPPPPRPLPSLHSRHGHELVKLETRVHHDLMQSPAHLFYQGPHTILVHPTHVGEQSHDLTLGTK
jgi:hypothetical protein